MQLATPIEIVSRACYSILHSDQILSVLSVLSHGCSGAGGLPGVARGGARRYERGSWQCIWLWVRVGTGRDGATAWLCPVAPGPEDRPDRLHQERRRPINFSLWSWLFGGGKKSVFVAMTKPWLLVAAVINVVASGRNPSPPPLAAQSQQSLHTADRTHADQVYV